MGLGEGFEGVGRVCGGWEGGFGGSWGAGRGIWEFWRVWGAGNGGLGGCWRALGSWKWGWEGDFGVLGFEGLGMSSGGCWRGFGVLG